MRHFGCLTPFGLGAGLVALAGVLLAAFLSGGSMFSPGPLNALASPDVTYGGVSSHAALGGDCGACHSSPFDGDGMDTHCLTCHTNIQAQQADPTSLHGIIPASQGCIACHSEHLGAEASLTNTSLTDFDHAKLGFALTAHQTTAAGQPFTCADCHPGLAKTPHPSGAYGFTASYCQDCHADYQADFVTSHVANFGTDCIACHDGVDRYSGFDHNTLAFRLEGKHATATCVSCHTQARDPASFKGLGTTCLSCHQADDVHKGAFGPDCAGCHSVNSWEGATFNHNQTAFPLTGAHIKIVCADCHGNHVYKGTPTACVNCHADPEVHRGQFGTDCAACHTTDTWKGVTFDHSQTAFPLTGAHEKVVCASCHVNNVFKGTPTACVSCHADPEVHRGQFGTDCVACHTTSTWKGVTFDHNQTAFRLTGAHSKVACASCHVNNVYKGTPTACVSCHADPQVHRGQFGTNCASCHTTSTWKGVTFDHSRTAFPLTGAHTKVVCASCHVNNVYKGTPTACVSCHADPEVHRGKFGTSCASCHTTSTWKGVTFDHNRTAFPLTGVHTKVDCANCHVNNVYKGTPTACVSCHADPEVHRGQFGTNCASCHTTDTWKGVTFNHNQTAFPLTGAHVNVGCASCHVNNVYKGTATACVGCHADPEVHRGQFGTNCNACHSTSRWTGAVFKHTAFPLNHGSRTPVPCATCHPDSGNYKSYTCYGCHAHTPANVAAEHREVNSADLNNCLRCHSE